MCLQVGIGNVLSMEVDKPEELEAATDEAIAVCDGDARAAVRALLVTNAYLENELAMAVPAVSYGFSRGWYVKRREGS